MIDHLPVVPHGCSSSPASGESESLSSALFWEKRSRWAVKATEISARTTARALSTLQQYMCPARRLVKCVICTATLAFDRLWRACGRA